MCRKGLAHVLWQVRRSGHAIIIGEFQGGLRLTASFSVQRSERVKSYSVAKINEDHCPSRNAIRHKCL
jgi:hypothetical protein